MYNFILDVLCESKLQKETFMQVIVFIKLFPL